MGGWRKLMWGIALAVVVGADASAASAPVLRENASEAEIEAWIDAHVDQDPNELRGVTYEDSVEYYDPRQLEKRPDGSVLARFHLESWRPQKDGRFTYRSERQQVELDCQTFRYRFLSIEAFSENNLRGRSAQLSVESEWTPVLPEDDVEGQEVRQACSFAALLDSPGKDRGMPAPPQGTDDATYDRWVAANIIPGQDILLTRGPAIAYYYAPADLERTADGNVRAWIRQELFWPIVLDASGVRSTRTQYEIDCTGQRYAIRDLIVFPGQNQTGSPYAEFEDEDQGMTAIKAGAPVTPVLRAFCRLAEDRTLSVEEALRAPVAPPPEGSTDAAVEAWIKKHLNRAGYTVSSHDTDNVVLYEPGSLELLGNGRLAVTVRRETVRPPEPGRPRSVLFKMELDCAGGRVRILTTTTYRDSNLEGPTRELGGVDLGRAAPGSHEFLLMSEVCPHRALLSQDIERAAALTPPPVAHDDEASVLAWMIEYIRPLEYIYAGRAAEAVGFYSWSEGERTRQDYVRVWTRYEYFVPQIRDEAVVRSMRRLVEYDCDEGRSRILETETYPGANLSGRHTTRRHSTAEWSFNAPATLENELATAVCDISEGPTPDGDSDISAPRLPGRTDTSPL